MIAIVRGMKALGDCLFQRPYVRKLAGEVDELYLGTPWPQLYSDLKNVRPCRVETRRIISNQNSEAWDGRWHEFPASADREIKVHNVDGSPVRIGESFGLTRMLPPECPEISLRWMRRKPIAVIRPPARRSDWNTENREPSWYYINEAALRLEKSHYLIAVGGPSEQLIGPRPAAHESYLSGELDFYSFVALVASADVIVAGIGSMVPLAIALRKRALIVLGGRGGTCSIESVCAPRWRHRITFVKPDPYCMCSDPSHDCNKVVPDFAKQLERFLEHDPALRRA